MFSPAQMTLPIKLGPRLWEILYPSPAPPQFSWTTSEKSFNLQGSPILFLASEKLCQDAGCVREFLQWYRMQRLLWAGPIKVLQVKLGCVYTWPENCWTGWDWVNFEFRTRWQNFSSGSPLCTPQGSLLHFPELFPDVYKNPMKYKIDTAKLAVQLPLKTIFKLCHVRNGQQDKIAETF